MKKLGRIMAVLKADKVQNLMMAALSVGSIFAASEITAGDATGMCVAVAAASAALAVKLARDFYKGYKQLCAEQAEREMVPCRC